MLRKSIEKVSYKTSAFSFNVSQLYFSLYFQNVSIRLETKNNQEGSLVTNREKSSTYSGLDLQIIDCHMKY